MGWVEHVADVRETRYVVGNPTGQMNKDEMDGACSKHRGDVMCSGKYCKEK
jgi:hypothetical protein